MHDAELEMIVPEELAGLRLDQALARMFPEYSRSRLKEWILDGAVTVNGEPWRPRDATAGGERIRLRPTAEPEAASEPQPIDLVVAFENESVIVVDKPAGLVVHPGAGNPGGTLMNGLLHRYPELAALPRAGIVHRLDKDTTGVLLVARTMTAHTSLVRQLAERRITRRYDAVCLGVLTGGGTIDAPIGRHRIDRKRMTVRDDGKPAVTRYTVIARYSAHTRVRVELDTGRTHQIRVHLASIGHPVAGDAVYATGPARRGPDGLARLFLHAWKLEFLSPGSGRLVRCEAPLPGALESVLDALRAAEEGRG